MEGIFRLILGISILSKNIGYLCVFLFFFWFSDNIMALAFGVCPELFSTQQTHRHLLHQPTIRSTRWAPSCKIEFYHPYKWRKINGFCWGYFTSINGAIPWMWPPHSNSDLFQEYYIFRIGDPYLNLHLPLASCEGGHIQVTNPIQ